jgi:hypothetical protein
MAGPLNYTTKVPATRTVAEVSDLLVAHGVNAVAVTYADRERVGLRFAFRGESFDLPVNIEAMHRCLRAADGQGRLKGTGPDRARWTKREHAERVAWRVIKDWVEAQMALVAAEQATLDEVMLPYLITRTGRALREDYRNQLALEAPR